MNRQSVHHREDVLRAVVDLADQRRDAVLPTDVPGVRDTFPDEAALVAALQLRWHTRLSGCIERALLDTPDDLETAVVSGWRAAAAELAGVRMVLDAQRAVPATPEVGTALRKAHAKEAVLLAAMAGRASASDPAAVRVGERIEQRARATYEPTEPTASRRHLPTQHRGPSGLIGRIKAHVAA